jgi:hypothetical protein
MMEEQKYQALFPEKIASDLRALCFPSDPKELGLLDFPPLSPLHPKFNLYWVLSKSSRTYRRDVNWPFENVLPVHNIRPGQSRRPIICEEVYKRSMADTVGKLRVVIHWPLANQLNLKDFLWLYSVYAYHTIPCGTDNLVVPRQLSELLTTHLENLNGGEWCPPTAQISAVDRLNRTIEVIVGLPRFITQVIPVLREYNAATTPSECNVNRRLIADDDTNMLDLKGFLKDDITINDMQKSVLVRLGTPKNMLFPISQLCTRFE